MRGGFANAGWLRYLWCMTIVTVFRSRLREGVKSEFQLADAEMSRIAASIEGFIDQKSYVAVDGERVTIVRFADKESHRTWAEHPEHLAVQRRGREVFYSWYDISVGEASYVHLFGDPDV